MLTAMKPHINLREIRERQRLSQVELAKRVDPRELLSFGTPVRA
jgi:hypothetical protein